MSQSPGTSSIPTQPSPPLRILHLTLAADAGGLTRYITTLSAEMIRHGHAVTAAGDAGAWEGEFARAGVPYMRIPLRKGLVGMRQSARAMRARLREYPVDVIHTHYRRATFLARRLQRTGKWDGSDPRFGGGPLDVGGSFRYPPILYTLHLSHIDISGWRRFFADWGDHTHVASRDARHWLIRAAGLPEERITLIPHGIDTARFPVRTEAEKAAARLRFGLPEDALVLAFVGRLDHPKNAQWCAQVVTSAHRQWPNLHLIYAGAGSDRADLEVFAVREAIADRVRFLGEVDPLPLYQAADLLLLPSEREGFSLVCAEAMSVGVPHVRTRTSGTSELTIENQTGVSVEIDRTAFIGATMRLLNQPEELRRMGQNGARLIREKFTFDRQVHETVALYRRLISRK